MAFKDLVGGLLSVAIPTFGETVYYHPDKGGSFTICAVFDEAFEYVDPDTEELVATVMPAIGVKLADIPFKPTREDEVRIGKRRFEVVDSQEDGQGGARIILHEKQ